jgi:hypothetical protein
MGKSRPKDRAEKEQDLRFKRFVKVVDSLTALGSALIRYSAVVLPFYFMYRTAAALAGKTTTADIGFGMFGSLRIDALVGYAVGVVGTLYGLRQQKLRRDKTEYLQGRIRKLEMQSDPKRSSSKLTPRGTTNPLDRE